MKLLVVIILICVTCVFSFWLGRQCKQGKLRKEIIRATEWGKARHWLKARKWEFSLYESSYSGKINVNVEKENLADVTIRAEGEDDFEAIQKLIEKVKKFEEKYHSKIN